MFVLLKQRTSNKLCDFHNKVWFVSSCKHVIVEFLYRRALPRGSGLIMILNPLLAALHL